MTTEKQAEIIYYGGPIVSMDDDHPEVEAVAGPMLVIAMPLGGEIGKRVSETKTKLAVETAS